MRFLAAKMSPLLLLAFVSGIGCALFEDPHREILDDLEGPDRAAAEEFYQRGVQQVKHGKLRQASTAFQNALVADDSFGPAHNNLGLIHFENGDLYSAAWSFERAVALLPENPAPLNNLGMAYEAGGRIDEAIEMYESAHSLEAENAEYLGNLVRAKVRRGDNDDLLRFKLRELAFLDTRPEWVEWANDQLVLFLRPNYVETTLDDTREESRSPELIPTPRPTTGSETRESVLAPAENARLTPAGGDGFSTHFSDDLPPMELPIPEPRLPILPP